MNNKTVHLEEGMTDVVKPKRIKEVWNLSGTRRYKEKVTHRKVIVKLFGRKFVFTVTRITVRVPLNEEEFIITQVGSPALFKAFITSILGHTVLNILSKVDIDNMLRNHLIFEGHIGGYNEISKAKMILK